MIKKIKGSLFAKVLITTTVFMLCISFLVYGLLAWFMPRTYSVQLNVALDGQARSFISELEQTSMSKSGGLFDRFLQNETVSFMELYTETGKQIPLPTALSASDSAISMTAETADTVLENSASRYGAPVLSNSYYFSFKDSDLRYMLTVYGEAARIRELQYAFLKLLPLFLLIIAGAALAASLLYSHIITRPVLRISRISKEMSDLQLEWRLEENRTDELGTLEKSLNSLSRRLSGAIADLQDANARLAADIEHERTLEQARTDFFSAASHELKTPITIIKGQLEGMLLGVGAYRDREKYLARSLEVADTLETMAQEILTISRLETAGSDFKTEIFDCAPVIREYLSEIEDLIVRKEIEIRCDLPAAAPVSGNRLLLEKVFSNLIGNAVKYSPQKAFVRILVCAGPEHFVFSVENSGTHLPEYAIPRLFDAFYRVDLSRNRKTGGSGLGLYIVQEILRQHGSSCLACNTAAGVQFSFTLPGTPPGAV